MPQIYQGEFEIEEMDFDQAVRIMEHTGRGGLLDNLENFLQSYYEADSTLGEWDMDEWMFNWRYEISAFNKVCREMRPLFVEEAA